MSENAPAPTKPESHELATPPGSPGKRSSSSRRDRSSSKHHHHHRDRSRSHHHHHRHHHRHHTRSRSPEKDRQSSRRDSSSQSYQQQQQQQQQPPPPLRKRASGWDSGTSSSSIQFGVNSNGGSSLMNPLTMPESQGMGDAQARRLYIGNVQPELSEHMLIEWVNALMIRGKLTISSGNPVTGAIMHPEKTYAFLDFRCPEEATAALSLDGLKYNGSTLRFRRPTDYRPPITSTVINSDRAPQLSEAMRKELGFSAVPSAVPESPDKMYVGGLPANLTEEQIIELLTKCGDLEAFDLIRDYQTGISRGYAFFLYKNPAESNQKAIESFNGIQIGGKTLFVQLASYGAKAKYANPDDPLQSYQSTVTAAEMQAQMLQQQQQQPLPPRDLDNPTPQMLLELNNPADRMISMMVKAFSDKARGVYKDSPDKQIVTDTNDLPDSDPTPVLQIANMASMIEINNAAFYENLLEDIRSFFSEFGEIISIHIPRTMERILPGQFRFEAPLIGQGRVFVEFEDATAAKNAQKAIKFRCYNGRALITKFIPLGDYHRIITTNESILKEAHGKYVEELKRSYREAEEAIFTVESLEDSLRLANSKQLLLTNGPSQQQQQQQPQMLFLTQAPAVPIPTLPPESKNPADENDDLFR